MNAAALFGAVLVSLLGVAATPPILSGPPQTPPQFEVASVKPNASGDAKVQLQTPPGGRFIATNATLRQLILYAYRLQESQLAGGLHGSIATASTFSPRAMARIPRACR
jgi:hypothetical protein